MNKHTAGEWGWRDGMECAVGIEPDPEGQPIAVLASRGAETFPNAMLIAAAPDLLAALDQVLLASEDNGDMDDIDWSGIRAAIAKARGGAV